jgi:OOP family OmpA-OmpF porin
MARYRKSLRLSSYVPAALAMAGAAVVCLIGAGSAVTAIERASQTDVQRVLAVDGHDWVDVTVDGLIVGLGGTAPDEATRFRALTVAGTAVDAARIVDQMTVSTPDPIQPPRFSIEILRNDDGIALFGLIPAATDREALIERATEIAGGGTVTDLMETADFPPPTGWRRAVDFSMEALAQLPRSKISVAHDRVAITATTDSAQIKRRAETQLAELAPQGVRLDLNLSAPRPVIAPFTLRFIIEEDGPRFDACSADTDAARNRIVAAAREAGLEGIALCTVGLGVPSTRWAEAAEQVIRALKEIGKGSVTMSNADITLVADDTTPQEVFDRVVGELENNLPDVFALHSVLPEPVEIDGTGDSVTTPEFVATKSPEGLVQLRGRITDQRARDAVESFAKARFGTANVSPATRLDSGLPEGWPIRVLSALEALSLLNTGAVVVQPGFVSLTGVTGDQTVPAEISRLLSERLGDGADYGLEISYDPALDPVAALPTPEECVRTINAALAERKITFEPGSTEIEEGALQTIDKVAELLRECQQVRMEIGGHTDSQGSEEMNLNLSQARADAVLNAIMARRVLTTNLSAKGYGEEKPIASNETEAGREANRRIEFTLAVLDEGAPGGEEGEAAASRDGAATDESAEDAPADETAADTGETGDGTETTE